MLTLQARRGLSAPWFVLNKRSLKLGLDAVIELADLWDRWAITDRFKGCSFRIVLEE
jgi:hypothetical protein